MNETMKLAVVTGSVGRHAGGFFNSVREGSNALLAAGAEVDVFAPSQGDHDSDIKFWNPIVPKLSKAFGPANFRFSPELGARLAAKQYDVVHQHGLWMHQSFSVHKWRKSSPQSVSLLSTRGHLDSWALRKGSFKKMIVSRLYERKHIEAFDCIHALNESEADAISSFHPGANIVVIPNGVHMPSEPVQDICAPSSKQFKLGYVGRLTEQKGLEQLIQGWNNLSKAVRQNWCLEIVGWGESAYLEKLRVLIGSENSSVRLRGPLFFEQKIAFLKSLDAFILPSFSEGMPMSVLEAMSYGIPCFVSDRTNMDKAIQCGAAVGFAPDIDAISGVLEKFLDDKDFLTQVGDKGRQLVRNEYTWSSIADRMLDTYRWLLGSDPKPSFAV